MPAKLERCTWAASEPLLGAYHDAEWGVLLRDSRALWELLMLEGFQAGLAWTVILRKRDAFRRAFKAFDPERVARFAALCGEIDTGAKPWSLLADFFTADAAYIDPTWGRVDGRESIRRFFEESMLGLTGHGWSTPQNWAIAAGARVVRGRPAIGRLARHRRVSLD